MQRIDEGWPLLTVLFVIFFYGFGILYLNKKEAFRQAILFRKIVNESV
jgi:hypothetical protein